MSLLRSKSLLPLSALLLAATAAPAAVRTWPGAPPCHHTLQNCLNGVDPGDVVEIASDATIDESLLIEDRLVSLRAAEGFHPTLAAGRNLIVDFSPSSTGFWVPYDLVYAGLAFAGGRFEFATTRAGHALIERMDVTQVGTSGGLYLATLGTDTGSATEITLRQNRVRASLDAVQALFVGLNAPTQILIEDNLIESQPGPPNPSASRAGLSVIGTTQNGSVEIRRNRIVASVDPDAVVSPLREGIRLTPFGASVSFEVRVIDNLIDTGTQWTDVAIASSVGTGSSRYDITNNTIRSFGRGIALYDTSPSHTALTARIRNNIVARTTAAGSEPGLTWTPGHPDISNDHNLLFNTVGNSTPLGPNTLLADPQFASVHDLRLQPTSPAIDAGNYLAREALLHLGVPAPLDNDGLRREIGAWVDLGAFEFGDQSFTHNAGTSASATELSRPGLDDNPAALMHITRSGGSDSSSIVASPGPLSQSFGEFTQRWSLISSDGVNLPADTGFTIRQLASGGHAGTHLTSAANNFSVSGTSLSASWADLPSNWIFLVSATRGAGLSSTHNPHPFGAAHLNGAWRIVNTDSAAMPNATAFVVYAQAPSRNAFLHTVSAANLVTPVVSLLDHPALNGVHCANPHVAGSGSGQMPTPLVSVRYEPSLQRWYLLNASPAIAMAAGNRYAVVIDPRFSADACRGPLFGDGFE
ncbi:MAG: hypothetical protein IPG63_15725 [Xanthomonadales bacterium]|nr:hypothetical protein [Xanthomonadales bacterium]MCC6560200.1 hypothetical protein [Xanthomonadales bacterium]